MRAASCSRTSWTLATSVEAVRGLQAALAGLPGGQHLLHLADRPHRRVDEVGADLVVQLAERLLVPGRAAVVGDQLVRRGHGAVVEQRLDRAVRVAGQRQLLLVGQLVRGELGRVRPGC